MRFLAKTAGIVFSILAVISFVGSPATTAQEQEESPSILSPYWDNTITQWESEIATASAKYRLDPDLIASVIKVESYGIPYETSYAGAVGLMGIMPYGPEFSHRPTPDELKDPMTNIRWGCSILADIIRQSGGDIHAALAAYNGGWAYVNYNEPREYTAKVLDFYGRAVAQRNEVDPMLAIQWTIATEVRQGYIAAESWLLGGEEMPVNLRRVGEHTLFNGVDKNGKAWYVRAVAIPIRPVQETIEQLMY